MSQYSISGGSKGSLPFGKGVRKSVNTGNQQEEIPYKEQSVTQKIEACLHREKGVSTVVTSEGKETGKKKKRGWRASTPLSLRKKQKKGENRLIEKKRGKNERNDESEGGEKGEER